jgi:flagellar biosynthetic protein FliP
MKRLVLIAALLLMGAETAHAQTIDLGALLPNGGASATARMLQIAAILTVLSVAPGLLIMVTSFTRFIVALSFLRSGLGLQSTPANIVLTSLAFFMTMFVMTPTFDKAWRNGVKPMMDNAITQEQAFTEIVQPFREFMLAQVREKDIALFEDLSRHEFDQRDRAQVDLRVLIPAFMISELRRGFEIGFMIILPFLVIDLVVSTLTMSMGMMMLPPTVLSLPAKLLFFVMMDGWNLLVGSLVRSVA